MKLRKQSFIILVFFFMLIIGCSSSNMNLRKPVTSEETNTSSTNVQSDLIQLASLIAYDLRELKPTISIELINPNVYDVYLDFNLDVLDLWEIYQISSDAEAIGAVAGILIASAAIVKERTDQFPYQFRNVFFSFNNEKIGYVPIASCGRFMYYIKNNLVEEALFVLQRNIVFY